MSVLLGLGGGAFGPPVGYTTGFDPQSVATADFNGDGKLDLAVGNYFGETVAILPGNGDGTFQAGVNFDTGYATSSRAVADFNCDGKPDLAVTSRSVVVLTNTTRD